MEMADQTCQRKVTYNRPKPKLQERVRYYDFDGADVPASPSALREHQINFFMVIQAHNEAAGLKVTDPKNLLNLS
jgi:hypothetical protein